MKLPGWFAKFIRKEKFITIDDAEVGQLVELKFHDPRMLGIQAPNGQLTCTRFNPHEFEDRTIRGFVSFIGKWEGGPQYGKYIVVDAQSKADFRKFLLLKHEIESIRVLE